MTASRLRSALATSLAEPSQSLIKSICYPESSKFYSAACSWGVLMKTLPILSSVVPIHYTVQCIICTLHVQYIICTCTVHHMYMYSTTYVHVQYIICTCKINCFMISRHLVMMLHVILKLILYQVTKHSWVPVVMEELFQA